MPTAWVMPLSTSRGAAPWLYSLNRVPPMFLALSTSVQPAAASTTSPGLPSTISVVALAASAFSPSVMA